MSQPDYSDNVSIWSILSDTNDNWFYQARAAARARLGEFFSWNCLKLCQELYKRSSFFFLAYRSVLNRYSVVTSKMTCDTRSFDFRSLGVRSSLRSRSWTEDLDRKHCLMLAAQVIMIEKGMMMMTWLVVWWRGMWWDDERRESRSSFSSKRRFFVLELWRCSFLWFHDFKTFSLRIGVDP